LKPTPRHVRLSGAGATVALLAILLVAGGMWAEVQLYRRAETSARYVALFDSERVLTGGQVLDVRRRGGRNSRRATIAYAYAVDGREYTGSAAVRTFDRNELRKGSPVDVWYLPSHPAASWLNGDGPGVAPRWPLAVLVPCVLAALGLVFVLKRQSHLLTYGRPALATVRKVERKKSDKGSYWRVHYEWTVLSGATRSGRYPHHKKQPPAIGSTMPIVYDRDNPRRHSRYPLSLVRL
jgi:hypothetical protein